VKIAAESRQGSRPLLRRGLFVIGGPRSGTTILQNALNDSGDVFLFGEPDFHADPGTPDFGRRYNDMHRAWSNQPTKSTFCPAVIEGDGPWWKYFDKLSEEYKFVGSKVVLNPSTFLHDPHQVLNFYAREFYGSHFIFTFRNPLQVLNSTHDLQEMTGGDATPFDMAMGSYVATVSLCIMMLRNFPRVHVVFHDNMTRRTFSKLEKWLEIRLPRARDYYDQKKVRAYDVASVLSAHGEKAQMMLDLYRDFREAATKGFDLIQIGQNNANPSETHLTPIGKLARRCELISTSFAPYGRVVT
jgi:hypothetical protein